jgi:Flp pilus assembly protein TadD
MIKIRLVIYFIAIAFILALAPAAFAETEPTAKELKQEVALNTVLLQHDGDNAKYLNDLGFAYYRLHRIPEALTVFMKAVAMDPGSSTTRNNLGAAYMHLKEYGKAEEEFSKALAIDPNFVKAAYNLSVSLYRQNKYLAHTKPIRRQKRSMLPMSKNASTIHMPEKNCMN